MFEKAFLVGTGKTRRAWTIPLGFAAQVAIVGTAIVAPLVFVEKPAPLHPLPPLLRAPAKYGASAGGSIRLVPAPRDPAAPRPFYAPAAVPRGPASFTETVVEGPPEIATSGPACAGPGCGSGPFGDPRGIIGGLPLPPGERPLVPPPAEPRHSAAPSQPRNTPPPRIRVGGLVQESRLVHRVLPAYPVLAVRTRVSGAVRLHAIIGVDGRVHELRVLGGHPLLVPAAIEAVRQWEYQPAQLNGIPVEIDTDVTVTFNLSGMQP